MSNVAAIQEQSLPANIGEWRQALDDRRADIVPLLPPSVTWERFRAAAIAAPKQNPDIMTCDPRSLFHAIEQAANDGLLPDGKEGVITAYNEKQKDGSYKKVAKWNPMAWGLRKRAIEIDGIIVDAQPVYENDRFLRKQGDHPTIDHVPPPLGQPRGELVGAYAIFRRGEEILHREVMDAEQIERVKKQSKVQTGLLWTQFEEEAWRKTVLRRGFKSLPCSEKLEQIVRRDDDLYSFDQPAPVTIRPPAAPKPALVAPSPKVGGRPPASKKPAPEKRTGKPYKDGGKEQTETATTESPPAYDESESTEQLGSLRDELDQPLDKEGLTEIVDRWRTSVWQMLPKHQKLAVAALAVRVLDVFGEEDGPSFFPEHEGAAE
jgi:recombination protein RecT